MTRLLVALLTVGLLGLSGVTDSASAVLPDGRAYELVSPVEKNGVSPYAAVPSQSGEAVDFQARGAFSGAGSGSLNIYQATRTQAGWQTAPLTPVPTVPLGGLEEQVPIFFSADLSQTIFTTPESYAPGDQDGGALDLYQRSPNGTLSWLSDGTQGGAAPDEVTFDGATPNASTVVFSTGESLVPAATGLSTERFPEPEYLYERDTADGNTSLVDVSSEGQLLGSSGAVLGNGTSLTTGAPPVSEYVPADLHGTTTNAVSSDGSKIFFESPAPGSGEPVGLYLREGTSRTVKIAGSAQYEGASADGSLVFFTSSEGLDGASPDKQLYEFNTTGQQVGDAPPMATIPVSNGLNGDRTPETTLSSPGEEGETTLTVASTAGFLVGETIEAGESPGGIQAVVASIPDATHLVLTSGLAAYTGGDHAVVGARRPASITAISGDGAYVYFVAYGGLASNANSQGRSAELLEPNLYVYDTGSGKTSFIATVAEGDVVVEGNPAGLVAEPDVARPAVPAAAKAVLAFASTANLTGQNPNEVFSEIYRYSGEAGSLVCVSCTPVGTAPTGNASFGETVGGTYGPAGQSSPMDEGGDRIFFDTPDALAPEDANTGAPANPLLGTSSSTDVYEWEDGGVSLISQGGSSGPATLDGTTPSGNDVFFVTNAALTSQDDDGGYENVFDARAGGGFPAQAGGTVSCVGSGCRAAFGPSSVFAAPASAGLQGSGNLPAPAAAKRRPTPKAKAVCRRGSVRRRVRGRSVCVKRKASRTRHVAKKADRGRPGSGRAGVVNVYRSR